MTCWTNMAWANEAILKLKNGETTTVAPHGASMHGRVENGQTVTLRPLNEDEPKIGDVVLVKVKDYVYLHLVKDHQNRYLIGNNKGGINGWVNRDKIYGIAVGV